MSRTIKSAATTLFLLAFVLLTHLWTFYGIYADREFGTLYLFTKHRSSFRFYFSSPVGESDTQLSSLSLSDQQAELDFHEFVEVHGGYARRHRLIR